MGGRGNGSSIPKQPAPPPQVAPDFKDRSQGEIEANKPAYDINLRNAIRQYARADDVDSSRKSVSQIMNYKLENDLDLTANEQYIKDQFDAKAHPLGVDANLYRAAHVDTLQRLGLNPNSLNGMTDAQLKAALIGAEYQEKKMVSTAYDAQKSPFISGALAGGRGVIMEIKTPSGTRVVHGNPNQAEIVMAGKPTFRVVDARFTGAIAAPRNGPRVRQVYITVEVV